jgi:hydrogenase maturation protein HypF
MVDLIAEVRGREEELLLSAQRPVVLLKKRDSLEKVTELDTVGIMLPRNKLHYSLLDYLEEPVVMINPTADSIVKVVENKALFLIQSRGFVPKQIDLVESEKKMLSLGAEMGNTFCFYQKGKANLSSFIGTTSSQEVFEKHKKMANSFLESEKIVPDVILCDLHPEYNTYVFAKELSERKGIPLERVQHHKAHAYSVAGEHNLTDFTAIVCDGLGFGEDGNIWGGEVFHNSERIGHLEEQYQLGGDSATRYPAKMLFSILRKFLTKEETKKHLRSFFSDKQLTVLDKQLSEKFNSPITTSCGRILDAASFLLGFCSERTYDGRPAMVLEANSTNPFELKPIIKNNVLKTTPLFEFLVNNIQRDKKRLAATVQQYLAEGMYEIASQYEKPIVFSGGCAYNRIMSSYLIKKGVLVNEKVQSFSIRNWRS